MANIKSLYMNARVFHECEIVGMFEYKKCIWALAMVVWLRNHIKLDFDMLVDVILCFKVAKAW